MFPSVLNDTEINPGGGKSSFVYIRPPRADFAEAERLVRHVLARRGHPMNNATLRHYSEARQRRMCARSVLEAAVWQRRPGRSRLGLGRSRYPSHQRHLPIPSAGPGPEPTVPKRPHPTWHPAQLPPFPPSGARARARVCVCVCVRKRGSEKSGVLGAPQRMLMHTWTSGGSRSCSWNSAAAATATPTAAAAAAAAVTG